MNKELIEFAKKHTDVKSVCLCKSIEEKLVVIIIVDDTTKEHILDYNDFMFAMRELYENLSDFMIIDTEYDTCTKYMFNDIESIYNR